MVDILMTTYNGEAFVEEQIRSIISQSYSDWRLLIRDDGSEDNTATIIQSFAQTDYRIQIITHPNTHLGVAQNFMHLVSCSSAPYCMFCDQDDVWLPNKVEKMVSHIHQLDNNIPQVVYSNAYLWSPEQGIIADRNTLTYPTTLQQMLFLNTGIQGAAAIFNRPMCDLLRQPLSTYAMHDHALLLAGICLGQVPYIHQPLMYYRQHNNNLTGNAPGSMWNKFLQLHKNRHITVVSREHYNGVKAFYEHFQQLLHKEDKLILEHYLILPNYNFLKRLSEVSKAQFQLFDSTFLLLAKMCIRRYI
jgi:rhamnosyltransferase